MRFLLVLFFSFACLVQAKDGDSTEEFPVPAQGVVVVRTAQPAVTYAREDVYKEGKLLLKSFSGVFRVFRYELKGKKPKGLKLEFSEHNEVLEDNYLEPYCVANREVPGVCREGRPVAASVPPVRTDRTISDIVLYGGANGTVLPEDYRRVVRQKIHLNGDLVVENVYTFTFLVGGEVAVSSHRPAEVAAARD